MRKKRLANLDRPGLMLRLEDAARGVLRRRIAEGRVELLGLFRENDSPVWYIAAEMNGKPHHWRFGEDAKLLASEPPSWRNWIGDECPSPINLGDRPDEYTRHRGSDHDHDEPTNTPPAAPASAGA